VGHPEVGPLQRPRRPRPLHRHRQTVQLEAALHAWWGDGWGDGGVGGSGGGDAKGQGQDGGVGTRVVRRMIRMMMMMMMMTRQTNHTPYPAHRRARPGG
jgi:hypothetical protein